MNATSKLKRSTYLLIALLVIDIVLILLHTFHRLTVRGLITSDLFRSELLSMSVPGMIPDIFQYGQQLAVVILLLVAAFGNDSWIYGIWATAFSYILVDDMFELHERVGYALEEGGVPTIAGLPGAEVGQMLFLAAVGGLIFVIAGLLIWKGRGEARRASIHLSLLLFVAAFFGVGADLVQGFVMEIRYVSGLVKIIEDGGEMLIMAVIVWYSYRLAFEQIPDLDLARRVEAFSRSQTLAEGS